MNILAVEVNLICCEETVKALIGKSTVTAEKQMAMYTSIQAYACVCDCHKPAQ